jgi:hypothetical protein
MEHFQNQLSRASANGLLHPEGCLPSSSSSRYLLPWSKYSGSSVSVCEHRIVPGGEEEKASTVPKADSLKSKNANEPQARVGAACLVAATSFGYPPLEIKVWF